eukprot:TRINITY_DN133_c0_g1_i4.p1 TRINITY_DN133_c0_g1~~TRINITY_DN133_c0_g1_i4.p1  ORF type:complete len:179 (+),score=29.46 TRINITY_DN133_c0_g1_i4:109-645(+)
MIAFNPQATTCPELFNPTTCSESSIGCKWNPETLKCIDTATPICFDSKTSDDCAQSTISGGCKWDDYSIRQHVQTSSVCVSAQMHLLDVFLLKPQLVWNFSTPQHAQTHFWDANGILKHSNALTTPHRFVSIQRLPMNVLSPQFLVVANGLRAHLLAFLPKPQHALNYSIPQHVHIHN